MKNRTRNALLSAFFTYGQFGFALGATFFVTPLILRSLGARNYGLWLSSGETIGYFLLLDFGVFSILPWLIARADGQQNPQEIRSLLSRGMAVAGGVVAVLAAAALAAWPHIPAILHLSEPEWHALNAPLAWLVVLLLANLPFGVFSSLLAGLQDVRFPGVLNLAKAVLGPALTAALLLSGHGYYALVFGGALLPPLIGAACLGRAQVIAPELTRDWPRPGIGGVARLFREGIGAWLGSAGMQLTERSGAIVLASLGQLVAVPVLVCTSRVAQTLTQMAWVLPDNALVGFAQLGGENNPARLREVGLSIVRLNLVLAAGAACVVLAVNPAFVRLWVGPDFFGGWTLNALLAAEIVVASLVHALATVVAVQGNRLATGGAALAQGVVYVVFALVLGRRFSLPGIILADLIAPSLTLLPSSLRLLRRSVGFGPREVGREIAAVLLRAGPWLVLAGFYGWLRPRAWWLELTAAGLVITLCYLRAMADYLAKFPIPVRVRTVLQRARILPVSLPV